MGGFYFKNFLIVRADSYANYDIGAAEAEYTSVSDELARAQTALDVLNNTEKMEIVV